jgi:hypothetical protein
MASINRKYPGKSADEIFQKVHQMMDGIAKKLSLSYEADPSGKTGKVSKMGVTGGYAVKEGEVAVNLEFPFLMPGAMKKKVQEDIERKLDGLFA